jgi:hypothetical protein
LSKRISGKDNKMVVIKLQGGLGNQMFQYAVAAIIAKKNKTKVLIDDSIFKVKQKKLGYTPRDFELLIFEKTFNFAQNSDLLLFEKPSVLNKFKRKVKLNYPKIINEPLFGYLSDLNQVKSPVYLKGYFQCYQYFNGFEDFIRGLFKFSTDNLSQENLDLIPVLKNKNTIAIHVRRGDYVFDTHTNKFHGTCSMEYYLKGIVEVASKIKNPILVFFSDDSDWIKNNFEDVPFDKLFINHNKGVNSWIDMYLMSICSHNIIANSSFSWWAAWLNSNKDKIIVAPKQWFDAIKIDLKLIVPDGWITI